MSDVRDKLLRYRAEFSANIESLMDRITTCDKRQAEAERDIRTAYGLTAELIGSVGQAIRTITCVRDERNKTNEALNQLKADARVMFHKIEQQISEGVSSPITGNARRGEQISEPAEITIVRKVLDPPVVKQATPTQNPPKDCAVNEDTASLEIEKATRDQNVPKYTDNVVISVVAANPIPKAVTPQRVPLSKKNLVVDQVEVNEAHSQKYYASGIWNGGLGNYEEEFPDLSASANRFPTKASNKKFNSIFGLFEPKKVTHRKIQRPFIQLDFARLEQKRNKSRQKVSATDPSKNKEAHPMERGSRAASDMTGWMTSEQKDTSQVEFSVAPPIQGKKPFVHDTKKTSYFDEPVPQHQKKNDEVMDVREKSWDRQDKKKVARSNLKNGDKLRMVHPPREGESPVQDSSKTMSSNKNDTSLDQETRNETTEVITNSGSNSEPKEGITSTERDISNIQHMLPIIQIDETTRDLSKTCSNKCDVADIEEKKSTAKDARKEIEAKENKEESFPTQPNGISECKDHFLPTVRTEEAEKPIVQSTSEATFQPTEKDPTIQSPPTDTSVVSDKAKKNPEKENSDAADVPSSKESLKGNVEQCGDLLGTNTKEESASSENSAINKSSNPSVSAVLTPTESLSDVQGDKTEVQTKNESRALQEIGNREKKTQKERKAGKKKSANKAANKNAQKPSKETPIVQPLAKDNLVVADKENIPEKENSVVAEVSSTPDRIEALQSTPTDNSAASCITDVVSDGNHAETAADSGISTVGHAPKTSPPSDTKPSGYEDGVAPEPLKPSNRQQKKDKLLAEKERREFEKHQKREKNKLMKKAEDAAKRAAEDAEEDADMEILMKKGEEFEKALKVYIANTAVRTVSAETELSERIDNSEADKEESDRSVSKSNISRTKSNNGSACGQIEYNNATIRQFMIDRVQEHGRNGEEEMSLYLSILTDEMGTVVLDDFAPIYRNRMDTERSLNMEKDLYANIINDVSLQMAIRSNDAGDNETARKYAANFIENYIKIQEGLRLKGEPLRVGYKTDRLQEALLRYCNRIPKQKLDRKTAGLFFQNMLSFYEKSDVYANFFIVLVEEILKSQHQVFAQDAFILQLIRSRSGNELTFSGYSKLVTRTCTLSVS